MYHFQDQTEGYLSTILGQFNKGHLLKGCFRKKPYRVDKNQKQ